MGQAMWWVLGAPDDETRQYPSSKELAGPCQPSRVEHMTIPKVMRHKIQVPDLEVTAQRGLVKGTEKEKPGEGVWEGGLDSPSCVEFHEECSDHKA